MKNITAILLISFICSCSKPNLNKPMIFGRIKIYKGTVEEENIPMFNKRVLGSNRCTAIDRLFVPHRVELENEGLFIYNFPVDELFKITKIMCVQYGMNVTYDTFKNVTLSTTKNNLGLKKYVYVGDISIYSGNQRNEALKSLLTTSINYVGSSSTINSHDYYSYKVINNSDRTSKDIVELLRKLKPKAKIENIEFDINLMQF